jgi:hypothetical protein
MEKNVPKHLPIGKNYRDELNDMIDKNRLWCSARSKKKAAN